MKPKCCECFKYAFDIVLNCAFIIYDPINKYKKRLVQEVINYSSLWTGTVNIFGTSYLNKHIIISAHKTCN